MAAGNYDPSYPLDESLEDSHEEDLFLAEEEYRREMEKAPVSEDDLWRESMPDDMASVARFHCDRLDAKEAFASGEQRVIVTFETDGGDKPYGCMRVSASSSDELFSRMCHVFDDMANNRIEGGNAVNISTVSMLPPEWGSRVSDMDFAHKTEEGTFVAMSDRPVRDVACMNNPVTFNSGYGDESATFRMYGLSSGFGVRAEGGVMTQPITADIPENRLPLPPYCAYVQVSGDLEENGGRGRSAVGDPSPVFGTEDAAEVYNIIKDSGLMKPAEKCHAPAEIRKGDSVFRLFQFDPDMLACSDPFEAAKYEFHAYDQAVDEYKHGASPAYGEVVARMNGRVAEEYASKKKVSKDAVEKGAGEASAGIAKGAPEAGTQASK